MRPPGINMDGHLLSFFCRCYQVREKKAQIIKEFISSKGNNLKFPAFRQENCKDHNIVCSRIKKGKAPLPRASPVRNQRSWYGTCHTRQRSLHLNEVDGGSAQRHQRKMKTGLRLSLSWLFCLVGNC